MCVWGGVVKGSDRPLSIAKKHAHNAPLLDLYIMWIDRYL